MAWGHHNPLKEPIWPVTILISNKKREAYNGYTQDYCIKREAQLEEQFEEYKIEDLKYMNCSGSLKN